MSWFDKHTVPETNKPNGTGDGQAGRLSPRRLVQALARRNAEEVLNAGPWSIGIGILIIVVYAFQIFDGRDTSYEWGNFWALLATLLALAFACFAIGGLLGFLFSIPRTASAPPPEPPPPAAEGGGDQPQAQAGATPSRTVASHQVNTNLEEISDWLTKIVVGVSLVQLTEIIGFIDQTTENIQAGFPTACGAGQTGCIIGLGTFSAAVIIMFFAIGLLFGYLWTRLMVQGAIKDADLSLVGKLKDEVEEKREALDRQKLKENSDAAAISLSTKILNARSVSDLPNQEDVNEALVDASRDVRSIIFYRARIQRSENKAAPDTTRMELTIPIFCALINADVKRHSGTPIYHQNFAQLAYALKDRKPRGGAKKDAEDYREAIGFLDKAIQIRPADEAEEWPLYEYNKALCQIYLDPYFAKDEPNPVAEDVKAVIDNLRAASATNWIRDHVLAGDDEVEKWLERNGMQVQDVHADDEPDATPSDEPAQEEPPTETRRDPAT